MKVNSSKSQFYKLSVEFVEFGGEGFGEETGVNFFGLPIQGTSFQIILEETKIIP